MVNRCSARPCSSLARTSDPGLVLGGKTAPCVISEAQGAAARVDARPAPGETGEEQGPTRSSFCMGTIIRHTFLDSNGIRMHVTDAGHGYPIFLLHGFP